MLRLSRACRRRSIIAALLVGLALAYPSLKAAPTSEQHGLTVAPAHVAAIPPGEDGRGLKAPPM